MPTKNLFISHIHEDDEHVSNLKSLLADRGYEIRNGSITNDKLNHASSESYIKHQILAPRIKWAGCLVVLVSEDTRDSDYVNWEIEYAAKNDIRVVVVYEPGERDAELPEAAGRYADAAVGWNADAILRAIGGENLWQNSSGSPRGQQPIERFGC